MEWLLYNTVTDGPKRLGRGGTANTGARGAVRPETRERNGPGAAQGQEAGAGQPLCKLGSGELHLQLRETKGVEDFSSRDRDLSFRFGD